MKLNKLIVLGATLTMAFGSVYAGEQGKKGPGMKQSKAQMRQMQVQQMKQLQYRNIDTDGDGKITRAEVQAHERLTSQMRKQWNTADKNKDGQVDTAEFSAFRERVENQLEQEGQVQQQEEENND